MKKIFYEKVGRKYVPVREYDPALVDALPKGTHVIMVYPGGQSTRYNIDPNHAALIAAGRVFEDAVCDAMHRASEIRMREPDRSKKLTPDEKAAWENLVTVFGENAKQLEWASIREIAEAGLQAMVDESDDLMHNPSVRSAYEHFELVCKLAKEHKNG